LTALSDLCFIIIFTWKGTDDRKDLRRSDGGGKASG
jgi:hypothetical protein